MTKVSVIVPVYNDSAYIERCLTSLIEQTLKEIEIIVVDDGSTDNTPKILEDFANKDERIRIITQENAKQGAARNKGLDNAKGEYISFIDSDDWIDLNYFENLVKAIEKYNTDIAVSEIKRVKKNNKINKYYTLESENVYENINDIIKVLKIPTYWFVWGKLYKKSLLEDMRFEENVFYEDAMFLFKVIERTKSLVTVPEINYYYFSNQNSTLKSKHSIAKRQDQINAMVNVINYAKEKNIKLGDITIFKDRHLLYTIKDYDTHKDLYICGLKVHTKNVSYDNSKVFVVFNTACFGDVLVCNSLCQNIKKVYPDSKVIFVVNKPFYDVAKNQKDVDEVIIYDKKGKHKGILGIWKFVSEFPYKKTFASFVTYQNCRNMAIAKLIGSRYVFEGKKRLEIYNKMQESHTELLQSLTNKNLEEMPVKCYANSDLAEHLRELLPAGEKYIALCTLTKNPPKDMPLETAVGLINKINDDGYKPVLTGAGEEIVKYADNLRKAGCDFIDLVNKTSIPELGSVLKNCEALISVDTGTMHYGYALEVPTVAVFYEQSTLKNWAPSSKIYNAVVVKSNQTPDNIYRKTKNLINGIKFEPMDKIAICLSCDNNYAQHCAAAISSVLKSKNSNEFINFYIIDGGISKENKKKIAFFEENFDCKITYVKPDLNKLKNCNTYKGDYISLATYYRLFIPSLIPNEDRVLYLDCDIIVRKSLSDLFNSSFDDNLVLGVIDVSEKEHSARLGVKQYINAGVVLFNSKEMRAINSENTIVKWIAENQEKIECHDQDVINAVFDGKIKYVENIYNAQVKKEHDTIFCDLKDPAILHFISPKKPWVHWKPLNATHWAKEYFKALEGTPWENYITEFRRKELLFYPIRLFYPKGLSRKIIRNIFSITNTSDRQFKVVTILGMKFQYKKDNKIVSE